MRISLVVAATLGLAALVFAHSRTEQVKTPHDVLQEFVKMELEGARLTPDAWRRTVQFFVRPPKRGRKILVASDKYELRQTAITENRAEFYAFFFGFYGNLDSQLRFVKAPERTPDGGIIKRGFTADYTLVLTDKHWETDPAQPEPREVTGPPEWRIDNPGLCCIIGLGTAIRYVTEMRDKTKDPIIKRNANQTLAKLRKLH